MTAERTDIVAPGIHRSSRHGGSRRPGGSLPVDAARQDASPRAPRRERVPEPPVWIIAAQADTCSAEDRASFAERAAAQAAGRHDRLLLVTCHRAELFAAGALAPLDASSTPGEGARPAPRLRILSGEAAVRHTFRLAAGLESAIVGEDQVLHQVRELRDDARQRGPLDPHLARLLEVALRVGRRARAARDGLADVAGTSRADTVVEPTHSMGAHGPSGGARNDDPDDSLAVRALDWLGDRAGARPGAPVLVVGAGEMGVLVAREARRRGYEVVVASRTAARAEATARLVGGTGVDLAASAEVARSAAGVLIALAGPWREAPSGELLPPTVDLSSPSALPRARAVEQLDIDGLYAVAPRAAALPATRSYEAAAEPLVEEAVQRYSRWSAGRASIEALRRVREGAEASRRDEFDRLLRRLPDLGPRERALVDAFSQRLVATLLHGPTVRLRDDRDGSAADAARRLFGL